MADDGGMLSIKALGAGVRVYAPMSMSRDEKVRLLTLALETYTKGGTVNADTGAHQGTHSAPGKPN